jgi:hypothetical protein
MGIMLCWLVDLIDSPIAVTIALSAECSSSPIGSILCNRFHPSHISPRCHEERQQAIGRAPRSANPGAGHNPGRVDGQAPTRPTAHRRAGTVTKAQYTTELSSTLIIPGKGEGNRHCNRAVD